MEKETNMEKIRELALKHFDAHEISVEPGHGPFMDEDNKTVLIPASCKITHPFFSARLFATAVPDGEVALYKAMDNPEEFEKVKAELVNAARAALSEAKNPQNIFAFILDQYQMQFMKETAEFLSPSDCSRALRTIASSVTDLGLSPSEHAQYKADILDLFEGSFVQQDFMLNIEKEYYDALPDIVTVYHGVNEENGDYEISDIFYWTTEIEQLVPTENFGVHESDEGIVYEAKIRKEDIYAYLVLDDTVFLNPDKLFNILHHKNFPLDDIELSDEDTIRR